MNFYLLPPARVDEWWPLVKPMVCKVLDYPMGIDLYDWWDIYSDLKNEKALCMAAEDLSYVCIGSVVTYPKAKILDMYLSAAADERNVSWDEVDAYFKLLCEALGCTHITVTGRRGWEKVLKPLGYSFGNVMLMKEVQNVPLPNDGDAPAGPSD